MRPNDPISFGDILLYGWRPKRRIMVIANKVERSDSGGGWFLGMRLEDGRLVDGLGPRSGNIGLYQRQAAKMIER